jgi:hypothetical protein
MADNVNIKDGSSATVVAATYEMPDGSQAPKVQPLGYEYEFVAASATYQVLGATGAAEDLLNGVLVIPATTSPGAIVLRDGSSSPDVGITIFTGGADSVSNLVPFFIPLGIRSVNGAWNLTTGSNVSCVAVGDFV